MATRQRNTTASRRPRLPPRLTPCRRSTRGGRSWPSDKLMDSYRNPLCRRRLWRRRIKSDSLATLGCAFCAVSPDAPD
eukprot:838745-Prymnesium_polylepis.1